GPIAGEAKVFGSQPPAHEKPEASRVAPEQQLVELDRGRGVDFLKTEGAGPFPQPASNPSREVPLECRVDALNRVLRGHLIEADFPEFWARVPGRPGNPAHHGRAP